MTKNKLHTITDEDAKKLAEILLIGPTYSMYDFTFDKITRYKYNEQDGVDAEESVNVYFNAVVKIEAYRSSGYKDKTVMINLIDCSRYHDYPYFSASYKENPTDKKSWSHHWLSNHIEAVKFLQSKNLL